MTSVPCWLVWIAVPVMVAAWILNLVGVLGNAAAGGVFVVSFVAMMAGTRRPT